MTKEEQRIAIAEACGWTNIAEHHFGLRGNVPTKRGFHLDHIPDYLNDLNAMHEAEKVLEGVNLYNYGVELAKMVLRPEWSFFEEPESDPKLNGLGFAALAMLTAAQRAEAFLRTIGKWKD